MKYSRSFISNGIYDLNNTELTILNKIIALQFSANSPFIRKLHMIADTKQERTKNIFGCSSNLTRRTNLIIS